MISTENGEIIQVRTKDVVLLHPGPLFNLDLSIPVGEDKELVWQLTLEAGGRLSLEELAELFFGFNSPSAAWAAWQWVEEGIYFSGTPEVITACTAEEVSRKLQERQARQAAFEAWQSLIKRAREGKLDPQLDARYLREIEDLANGRRTESRLMRELGRDEHPETAHALLLEWGIWNNSVNPNPRRLNVPLADPPDFGLFENDDLPRLDLTHLPAFAIDDRGNQDPDDAISLAEANFDESGKLKECFLWIHVADVASQVRIGETFDNEARMRGATLYLPEGKIHMLPEGVIHALGMGLQERSPALSFGVRLNSVGEIVESRICLSRVQVQRLNYEQVEMNITQEPFSILDKVAGIYLNRRKENGAVVFDLPEIDMQVSKGQVSIRPLPRFNSRAMVREAMLMACEAAACYAIQKQIPFPFVVQNRLDLAQIPGRFLQPTVSPQSDIEAREVVGFFRIRRSLAHSLVRIQPGRHTSLGLPSYSRVTSPLRRYLDLLAHYQLRASLFSTPLLGEQEMIEIIGTVEAASSAVNQAEFLSRRHWTLVYLLQHPGWQGEAILAEKNGLRSLVFIPELAFETHIHLRKDIPLGTRLTLTFQGADLAGLEAHFTTG